MPLIPFGSAAIFATPVKINWPYLKLRAAGENEIMAANAVNKLAGKQTCADYISVSVIPGGEKVVTTDGLVLKVQPFTFLPENAEKWTGTFFGTLDQMADKSI